MSPAVRRWSCVLAFLAPAWLGIVEAGTTQLGNSNQLARDFKDAKGKWVSASNNPGSPKEFPNEMLDVSAQYWAFGVTWASVLDDADKAAQHVKHFHDHIFKQVAPTRATDLALINAYSPVLVARFKELTDLPVKGNARALAYGEQMLPTLAKLQHPSIGKYLAELLDPKGGKHDLIKLGAIKGLREFMPVDPWGEPINQFLFQDKIKMASKEADLERIDFLTQFILRPPPPMAAPEELEAYRYLRREAIETLAHAGAPAVAAVKKVGKIEGPIAAVLLRVLIPGAMTPETNLHEQDEAARGLCRMKPLDKYEPAPTYYFVNKAFFDLARDYSEDFTNIAAGDKDKRTMPTKFPWKITAKRWEEALRQLVANAPAADKKKAEKIEGDARPVLRAMFDHKNINANDVAPNPSLAPKAEFHLFNKALESEPLKWDGAK